MVDESMLDALVSLALDGELATVPFCAGVPAPGTRPLLEVEALTDHPIAHLARSRPGTGWDALALVADGTAHDGERSVPCMVGVAMHRSGACAGEVRVRAHDGRPVRSRDPAGLLTDACRRTLGLPTAPPPLSASQVAAWAWLDGVVVAAIEGTLPDDWDALVARHPFASLPGTVTWTRARDLVATGTLALEGIDPAEAEWCDDGAFSRWWMHHLGDLDDLLAIADALIPEATLRRLLAAGPAARS